MNCGADVSIFRLVFSFVLVAKVSSFRKITGPLKSGKRSGIYLTISMPRACKSMVACKTMATTVTSSGALHDREREINRGASTACVKRKSKIDQGKVPGYVRLDLSGEIERYSSTPATSTPYKKIIRRAVAGEPITAHVNAIKTTNVDRFVSLVSGHAP